MSSTTSSSAIVMVSRLLDARIVTEVRREQAVRRQCGARAAGEGTTAIALRGYTSAAPWPAGEQRLVMAAAYRPAHAWVFPVGDGTANLGYGELIRSGPPTRAHLTQRLHELLPDCPPPALALTLLGTAVGVRLRTSSRH